MTTPAVISEVSISNMALARVGSTQTISSFADGSNEANQCLLWYPGARDALLADFPWPWAEAYAGLAQVAGPEINGQVANAQWSRSYRYPSDCLKVRRIVATPLPSTTLTPQTSSTASRSPYANQPWKRNVGQPFPISYGLANDTTGRLIVTDSYGNGAGLTCVYTQAVADPTQFAPDFADALAWRIAIDLSQSLSVSSDDVSFAARGYENAIRKARATAMNEIQSDIPLIRYQSETVRARWGG